MADKLERIQLSDDQVIDIAGGYIHYYDNPIDGRLIWGDSNPDVQYTFKDRIAVLQYITNHGIADEGGIQELLNAGLIWPK